jgi:hypothetical protein
MRGLDYRGYQKFVESEEMENPTPTTFQLSHITSEINEIMIQREPLILSFQKYQYLYFLLGLRVVGIEIKIMRLCTDD